MVEVSAGRIRYRPGGKAQLERERASDGCGACAGSASSNRDVSLPTTLPRVAWTLGFGTACEIGQIERFPRPRQALGLPVPRGRPIVRARPPAPLKKKGPRYLRGP